MKLKYIDTQKTMYPYARVRGKKVLINLSVTPGDIVYVEEDIGISLINTNNFVEIKNKKVNEKSYKKIDNLEKEGDSV